VKFIDIGRYMGVQPGKLVGGSRLLWYIRFEAIRAGEIERARRERKKASSLDEIEARRRKR
jgi:hypothetical protein